MSDCTPRTYTASQVAALFQVSASLVCKQANTHGHFRGCRVIRVGRSIRFSRAAIDAVLSEYDERVA